MQTTIAKVVVHVMGAPMVEGGPRLRRPVMAPARCIAYEQGAIPNVV